MEVELRGEVERLADAAGDVGDTEAGEEMVAVAEIARRESDRHVDDERFAPGGRRRLPERNALATVDDAGTRERQVFLDRAEDRSCSDDRNDQHHHARCAAKNQRDQRDDDQHDRGGNGRVAITKEERLFGLIEGGEKRQICFRIATEKIEDACAAGIDAGGKRRP